MQGLRSLYEYQGRYGEWARLVAEIIPDYCDENDESIAGREDAYRVVMEYRVRLIRERDWDPERAAALQNKVVEWDRRQAAAALALPETASLDAVQYNLIRTLGVSLAELGQILSEQDNGDCVAAYQESFGYYQRIADATAEAISYFNLGHAYKDIPEIRDLDAAESAYRKSLALFDPNDALGCFLCIQQIGMANHERFYDARKRGEAEEILLRHAQAAQAHYHEALQLCPVDAVNNLGPLHNQLGNLYDDVGQTEAAHGHNEQAAQIAEQTSNRYHAGVVRRNMALMYRDIAGRELSHRRELLLRARAYAEAALRDFQHYQGRAADMEAKVRQLIAAIDQTLAES